MSERTQKSAAAPVTKTRTYMRGSEREQLILAEAVRFFAEHGFEGQTRELAKRMGISHSAIYRHFPSKDVLIERVYEHVFLSRWNADWAKLIKDRKRPLEARLRDFYLQYAARVFDYDWVRVFVFSGLKDVGLTQRYLAIVESQIIKPACVELRYELGVQASPSPTEREKELFWALHGSIFYLAIRAYVYNTQTPDDLETTISNSVQVFIKGVRSVVRSIAK